jgi:glycerol-3-phosphate dehydrogenase
MAGHRFSRDNAKVDLRRFEQLLDAGQHWSLFEYDDAQCEFPERLVAEWLNESTKAGAAIRNYCHVMDILQCNGKVSGVIFHDRLSDQDCSVQCKWVINATGPWVDQLCSETSVPTGAPLVGGVRGSHIVLPRFAGAPETALYTQGADGRQIFVIPWNGQLLVGTTEVPDCKDPANVEPSTDEIDYLLRSTNRVFPSANVSASDVHYAYAGIRPLPYVKDAKPSAVSRKAILWDHKNDGLSGMISIIGGKLTTAVSLARRCSRMMGFRPEPQVPVSVAAWSASGFETAVSQWAETMARHSQLTPETAHSIVNWHGPRAMCIVRIAMTDPLARQPLCPHTHHIVAEAINAFRFEHAITLADVLLRRVPVALGACWSRDCSRAAAIAIGAGINWSSDEIDWQLENMEEERAKFLFKPAHNRQRADVLRTSNRVA